MTSAWPRGLLVSVRDAEEAAVAVAGGAAIIDVKEPRNGPLGRPPAETVATVAGVLPRQMPLTLACGELASGDEITAYLADVRRALPPDLPPPRAVKAGPAGLALDAWRTAFSRLQARLPPGTEAVAVAYADWRRADAPPPEVLLTEAIRMKAAAFLVDTFDKQGPALFATISPQAVAAWSRAAEAAGLALAVAGRLAGADVAEALRLGAGVVGVRSAACDGGRDGRIAAPRVRLLARLAGSGSAPTRPISPAVPSGVHVS
ncbi:MAG: (5-formylfuran-3-yl)methyl phosphate synthase [Planctomycetota bacterium]